MSRRILLLFLLLLMMATSCAFAEEAALDIRSAASIEEALAFLILPEEGSEDLPAVQRGSIRYITQDLRSDPSYRKGYWLGGEEGSVLDLTLTENRYGHAYTFHTGVMCTRAAYTMALSYLGIDMTPGQMSALTGQRHLDPPYKEISARVGVELAIPKTHVFNTMMDNYLTDSRYSPVYLYIEKPDGKEHALLVIAALPETSRYLVADPKAMWLEGVPHRIYMISLNKTRQQIVNSTFRHELAGSRILQLYQWRLLDETE